MVKVGDFTVELVAADTKVAFKEHTASDGQVYAEVEPDMDYFISLGSDIGGVQANIWVDGVDLDYKLHFFSPEKKAYNGQWERRDGKETTTALRFTKTREAQGVAPDMLTGKVEVAFYKQGDIYYEAQCDFVSASLTADTTSGGKKCIKSTTSGSHSFEVPSSNATEDDDTKVDYYMKGEHILTITLHYCSALGLIYHRILPPPPDSDDDSTHVKKEKPMKRKRSIETSISKTARVVSLTVNNKTPGNFEAQTVTVQQTYALVDLTACGGDEDD